MEFGCSEGSAGRGEDPPWTPPAGGTKRPHEDDITGLEPPPAPDASQRKDTGDKAAGKRPMTVLIQNTLPSPPEKAERDRALMPPPPDRLHLQHASTTAEDVADAPINGSPEMDKARAKIADIKPSIIRCLFPGPGDHKNPQQPQSQQQVMPASIPAAQQDELTQSRVQREMPSGSAGYRGPTWVTYAMSSSAASSLASQHLLAAGAVGGIQHQQRPKPHVRVRIMPVLPTAPHHQTLSQLPASQMPSRSGGYRVPTSGSIAYGASASSRSHLMVANASGGGNRPRHTPAWRKRVADRRKLREANKKWKAGMDRQVKLFNSNKKFFEMLDDEDEDEDHEEEEEEEDEDEEEMEEEEEEEDEDEEDEEEDQEGQGGRR